MITVEVDGWKTVSVDDLTVQGLAAIKNNLTFMLKVYDEGGRAHRQPEELFKEENGILYVPRQAQLKPYLRDGDVTIDSRTVATPFDKEYPQRAVLNDPRWPFQQEVVEIMVAGLIRQFKATCGVYAGGILQSPTGTGKTIMGLEVARRVGCKTAVVVHKEALATQWENASKEVFGDEPVGRIQARSVKVDGPVTVIMIQSITGKFDYSEVLAQFGMVIVDETHHLGAEVWSKAAPMFPAAFRLGVSAEPSRTDGADPVFRYHIGDVLHVVTEDELGRDKPRVKVIYTPEFLNKNNPGSGWVFVNGKPHIMRTMTWLGRRRERNEFIAATLRKGANKGRKILVLGHTHKHLNKLRELLGENYWTSKYEPKADLKAAAEAQIIFATYQMAKEGVDIPELDVLLMATPIARPVQAVGRITRVVSGKKSPLVIDLVDKKIGFLSGWARARQKAYEAEGYEVMLPD